MPVFFNCAFTAKKEMTHFIEHSPLSNHQCPVQGCDPLRGLHPTNLPQKRNFPKGTDASLNITPSLHHPLSPLISNF